MKLFLMFVFVLSISITNAQDKHIIKVRKDSEEVEKTVVVSQKVLVGTDYKKINIDKVNSLPGYTKDIHSLKGMLKDSLHYPQKAKADSIYGVVYVSLFYFFDQSSDSVTYTYKSRGSYFRNKKRLFVDRPELIAEAERLVEGTLSGYDAKFLYEQITKYDIRYEYVYKIRFNL